MLPAIGDASEFQVGSGIELVGVYPSGIVDICRGFGCREEAEFAHGRKFNLRRSSLVSYLALLQYRNGCNCKAASEVMGRQLEVAEYSEVDDSTHVSSMHAAMCEIRGASDPLYPWMDFRTGSGEINRHRNSVSSYCFNFSSHGGHNKQFQPELPQAAIVALATGNNMDLPADPAAGNKNDLQSDTRTALPRRHIQILELVPETDRRASMQSNSGHVCRYCKKCFSSGRALGGHMRTHGSIQTAGPERVGVALELDVLLEKEQLSDNWESTTLFDPVSESGDYHAGSPPSGGSPMLPSAWIQLKECNWRRSGFQGRRAFRTKWSKTSEDLAMIEQEDAISVRGSSSSEANNETEPFPEDELEDGKVLSAEQKAHPLYALRRNPKRSRRFSDQEFAFDAAVSIQTFAHMSKAPCSAPRERIRACSECGKEFLSWKALFGHMRCHPEREWRGIQPPDCTGQQAKGASSSGVSMYRERPVACPSFVQDSELELDSDLKNNRRRGETEEYHNRACSEETSMKGEEVEPSNKECKERKPLDKIFDGEISNTIRGGEVLDKKAEERASEWKQSKVSDNGSDIDSNQGWCMQNWSQGGFHGWITGKRSKRTRHPVRALHIVTSQEPETESITTPTEIKDERDMADCLVMLAYAGKSLEKVGRTEKQLTEESAFSDSGRNGVAEQAPRKSFFEDSEEEEMNWGGGRAQKDGDEASLCEDGNRLAPANGFRQRRNSMAKYECSTCKRSFNSHQALGGHRASHRKVKGCFARTNASQEIHESTEEDITDEEFLRSEEQLLELPLNFPTEEEDEMHSRLKTLEDSQEMASAAATTTREFKGHKCSICHRVFASGQALGGHKRCHWSSERTTETSSVASSNKQPSNLQNYRGQSRTFKENLLDLNLPAPLDEEDMEANHDMVVVVPPYGRYLHSNTRLTQSSGLTAGRLHPYGVSSDIQRKEHNLLCTREDFSVNGDSWRGLEEDAGIAEDQEFVRKSSQMQLNFSSRSVECNICHSIFTSVEAFSTHQKTHASLMSSIAGLTPISA